MSKLLDGKKGSRYLFMGNEAVVVGSLDAVMSFAVGYPVFLHRKLSCDLIPLKIFTLAVNEQFLINGTRRKSCP